MHVLVVGGGGRAHALAWKLAQSPRVTRLSLAPGNSGTAECAHNIDIDATDVVSLLEFAESERVDLTVVGPEEPLAGGLADQFEAAGLRIFGPRRDAAAIETSKSYAKQMMQAYGVPTAPYELFDDLDEAIDYVHGVPVDQIVIKADGLARGKGVYLPAGATDAEGILRSLMERDALGEAGRRVLIEQRLRGRELSMMAFTDGQAVVMMPPVADYKRLLDQDQGPNTGGMGAYAPVPGFDPHVAELVRTRIMTPVLHGLQAEDCCFRGVLFAGVILTDDGPMALELNVRLGDPAAQTVLPLLETDLLDVLEACADSTLGALDVRWSDAAAVTVVLATASYPHQRDPGLRIAVPGALPENVLLFHAGTQRAGDNALITTGGRVLDVVGLGASLPDAANAAYDFASRIRFAGMHYRMDIGRMDLGRMDTGRLHSGRR